MLTSFNNDRWTVVFLLFAVIASLLFHFRRIVKVKQISSGGPVGTLLNLSYIVCVLIRLILFRLRTENMIFSPCLRRHFYFWATRKGIVVFVGKKKHTYIYIYTPFFFGGWWREGKGKRENSDVSCSAKCVVRLHYQFLC